MVSPVKAVARYTGTGRLAGGGVHGGAGSPVQCTDLFLG